MRSILDVPGIAGFTLKGWIKRKGDGYRRLAYAVRADAGTQGEPTAALWDARAEVCEDLLLPSFKISRFEAIGRRLKRNYAFIFYIILVAWLTKIFLHAQPPIDSFGTFYAALRVGLDALRNVAHEAIPPAAPVLAKQGLHVATMLMEDKKSRLVDESVASADDSVKDVQIATPRNCSAGVQCFVEASQLPEGLGLEGHVRTGPQNSRPTRIEAVSWQDRSVSHAIKPAAKSTANFKGDLRFRLQFQRKDLASKSNGVAVFRAGFGEADRPGLVHNHIVIQES
jgi:hypothetical protein